MSESIKQWLDATHDLKDNSLHLKARMPLPLEVLHGSSRELAPSLGRMSSSDLKPSLGQESSPKLELSLGRTFQDELSTFDHLVVPTDKEAVEKKKKFTRSLRSEHKNEDGEIQR